MSGDFFVLTSFSLRILEMGRWRLGWRTLAFRFIVSEEPSSWAEKKKKRAGSSIVLRSPPWSKYLECDAENWFGRWSWLKWWCCCALKQWAPTTNLSKIWKTSHWDQRNSWHPLTTWGLWSKCRLNSWCQWVSAKVLRSIKLVYIVAFGAIPGINNLHKRSSGHRCQDLSFHETKILKTMAAASLVYVCLPKTRKPVYELLFLSFLARPCLCYHGYMMFSLSASRRRFIVPVVRPGLLWSSSSNLFLSRQRPGQSWSERSICKMFPAAEMRENL